MMTQEEATRDYKRIAFIMTDAQMCADGERLTDYLCNHHKALSDFLERGESR